MKISILTIVMLVALRLAIGWHLFYEGAWKEQHSDSWSSKGFLTAATGPGALPSRYLAGDPDASFSGLSFKATDPSVEVIECFTVLSIPDDEKKRLSETKTSTLHKYLPKPINRKWNVYYAKFVTEHDLSAPANAPTLAKVGAAFDNSKSEMVDWLLWGEEKVLPRPSFVRGSLDATQTTPERLREYQAKLDEIKEIQQNEAGAFSSADVQSKLDKAMRDEESLRKTMLSDLDLLSERMKDRVHDALTYDQKRIVVKPDRPEDWARIALMNGIVRYGLIGAGLCLLLGFLTRPACIVGVLFLVAFYLAAPPPPLGLSETLAKEHFYIINWNLVEAAGLLALATTASGRWLGLDALFLPILRGLWSLFGGKSRQPAIASSKEKDLQTTSSTAEIPAVLPDDSTGIKRAT